MRKPVLTDEGFSYFVAWMSNVRFNEFGVFVYHIQLIWNILHLCAIRRVCCPIQGCGAVGVLLRR